MEVKDKIHLNVRVQPRSQKPGVEKLDTGEYKVRVRAAPTKGEANQELVEMLASHFGVPRSGVKIVRGLKSRTKAVVIVRGAKG
ncbi:MAG: DUF167 domain-containing protein [Candidatus Aminicenantes bacterium]